MGSEQTTKSDELATEPVVSKLRESVELFVSKIDEKTDLPAQSTSIFSSVDNYPALKALLALLFFVALSKLVEWLVTGVIKKIVAGTSSQADNLIVPYLRSPIFWSVALLGFLVAASMLSISDQAQNILTSLVLSTLIFLWMRFGLKIAKVLLSLASQHAEEHALIRPQTLPLFTNLTNLTIVVFGIYLIFQVWYVDMTAWLASAGIAGIAIGFAAKDTLANLFSGVFIMADSPYKIGDYIVLDDGTGLRGKVTHIGIRSTRVLTRDDIEVTIPNSIMGNSKVINESGGPYTKYRIRVVVGVAYGSDIEKVKDVLHSVAEDSSEVCHFPEPRVRFRAFGPSSLNFELLCWIENPELRGRVLDNLNSAVYKKFVSENIEIPFSKQDLYIKELPNTEKKANEYPHEQL